MEEGKGFGNIIFYIILAVIALVSSFRNKKKQQEGMPGGEPAREQGRGGFPDDMFDDYEEETSAEEFGRSPGRPAEVYRTSRPTIIIGGAPEMEGLHEEPLAAAASREGVSALDHKETARRFDEHLREANVMSYEWEDHEQDDSDKEEFNFLDGEFEGRKAIVFAEIINRKEY